MAGMPKNAADCHLFGAQINAFDAFGAQSRLWLITFERRVPHDARRHAPRDRCDDEGPSSQPRPKPLVAMHCQPPPQQQDVQDAVQGLGVMIS